MRPEDTAPEYKRDFFISYTEPDKTWAEWIAWELEEAGYTTILQSWDFPAGSHFIGEMHSATQAAKRTIAVLSDAYGRSPMATAEWQEAWRQDPGGVERKLLVFRIADCGRPGLLGQVVSVDLFDVDQSAARSRLLESVREGRRKPSIPPGFPAQEAPTSEPPFPGRFVAARYEAAMAAGGPPSMDNPYAVAFTWWQAVLDLDYGKLSQIVTPESQGRWDLAAFRERTRLSGLTTGVVKPVYDVAYVKLVNSVPQGEGPQKIVGSIPVHAMVISLVLRPELGGWRVHGVGLPVEPEELPRTWTPAAD